MTNCRNCGREWGGFAECHCAGCHEHFSSVTAFERHQPRQVCVDPRTLRLVQGISKSRKSSGGGIYWTTASKPRKSV